MKALLKITCETETSKVSRSIAASSLSSGTLKPSSEGTVTTRAPTDSSWRWMYKLDGKFSPSETILLRGPFQSKQDAIKDWQMETLGCITTSPSPAPMIFAIRLPTAIGISHQPSSQARMLRVDHMSAYSAS